MSFLNLAMLFGLAATAIPIVIHLLQRRRFDVVDWGAMQFLQISQTRRRRLLIDELLLLLVRIGVIALIVLALARPVADAAIFGAVGSGAERLTIFVLDGSYSMGRDDGSGVTPYERARRWIGDYLAQLPASATAAVLVATETPQLIVEPTRDRQRLLDQLSSLEQPNRNVNWPRSLQAALELAVAEESDCDIVIVKDDQRHGWSDPDTRARWQQLKIDDLKRVRILVTEFDSPAPARPELNFALAPLQSGRAVAWVGQEIRLRSALIIDQEDRLPAKLPRIDLEVDGERVASVDPPKIAKAEQVPLPFSHRFDKPGRHRVAVIVKPEPADQLPGDNRQELDIEVLEHFPVLLVEGDQDAGAANEADVSKRSAYFLAKALTFTPDAKRPPVVDARVIPARDFSPDDLAGASPPRVLILADVPQLTAVQEQAVRRYVSAGGAVLVVIGSRVDGTASEYNEHCYEDDRGWLPARLDQIAGDVDRADRAATLNPANAVHPVFSPFQGQSGAVTEIRFPRWWKITPGTKATVAATFGNGDAFLVEKSFGKGKVMLCTAPLDRSWNANFPSAWEFPIFVHELVAYLADAERRSQSRALDLRESDLTAVTAEDRAAIAQLIPLRYVHEASPEPAAMSGHHDIWWLFLIGVSAFLCIELWLTRRMTMAAG